MVLSEYMFGSISHPIVFFPLAFVQIYRRHQLAGSFKPSAFREEAALMSEGENMFAFQVCTIPETDKKICHCEFLGCIAEDVEDEEEEGMEEDGKRGECIVHRVWCLTQDIFPHFHTHFLCRVQLCRH